jgi:hypothetical protein
MASQARAEPRAHPLVGLSAWPLWLFGILALALLVRLPFLVLDPGIYDAAYLRRLMQATAADLPSVYAAVSPDYPPLAVLIFGLTQRCCGGLDPVVAAKLPEVIASLVLAALVFRRIASLAAGQSFFSGTPSPNPFGGRGDDVSSTGHAAPFGGQPSAPSRAGPGGSQVSASGRAGALCGAQSAMRPWLSRQALAARKSLDGHDGALAKRSWIGGQTSPARPSWAVVGAAGYALNPGVVYVSAYWTQAEALWVLPLAGGLLALEGRMFVGAWMGVAAAVLIKPQAAAFVPLLLVATPVREWWRGAVAAIALAVVVSAPWWLTGHAQDVWQVYAGLSGADNWVSGSAYSLWYLVLLGRTHQVPADTAFVGPITYQQAGAALFVALLAWVVWQQRQGRSSVLLAGATLWLGLAVLLTQTHERYIHPVLPLLLLAPEILRDRRLWLVWVLVSLAYFYNLITVLPFDGFPGPSLIAETGGGMRVLLLRAVSLVAAASLLASLGLLAARLRWASAR